MVLRRFLAVLCVLGLWALPVSADSTDRLTFSTGGILRLPNTQQPSDQDNGYFEGWLKASWAVGKTPFSVFLRGKTIADTVGYSFNNHTTFGYGVSLKTKIGKRASAAFAVRHDWQSRVGEDREGTRFLIDYFFLDYHVTQNGQRMFGLDQKARIIKIYASLIGPETLARGNDNIAVTFGGELSANLAIPDSRFRLSPYLAIHVAWDSDENNWNNKAQPSLGVKLKWPLPKGDIHLGARYQGDYRWLSKTYRSGPGAFIGWYSSF